jgi:BMFP domain-containing protein YqiC
MLNDLAQKLAAELEKHLPSLEGFSPKRELQVALQAALRKMDLVTREEFDAQAAVLQRTRQRLEALEQQLAERETHTNPPG